jgi:hypothetical protein
VTSSVTVFYMRLAVYGRTVLRIAVGGNRCRPVKVITATRAINKSIINPSAAMRAVVIKRTVATITGLDSDNIVGAASITRKCVLHFTLLNICLFYITPLQL